MFPLELVGELHLVKPGDKSSPTALFDLYYIVHPLKRVQVLAYELDAYTFSQPMPPSTKKIVTSFNKPSIYEMTP